MSTSIRSGASDCAIQLNGVDAITFTGTSATVAQPLTIPNGTTSGQAVNVGQAIPIRTANVTPLPAAGSLLSASHSLGVVPSIVILELVCIVAEQSFSIGDVALPTAVYSGSAQGYMSLFKTTTTVGVQLPAGYGLLVANKSTGGGFLPTAARWAYRFIVR